MKFTFEDKLTHIFWRPIGPCLLEDSKDPGVKPDKRRASTAYYKQHRDAILELVSIRDRAKAVGLDIEFKKIVRSIVPGGINSAEDFTRKNVFNIDIAIIDKKDGKPSLKDKIEARERRMGVEVDNTDDTKLLDAIGALRASAPEDAPKLQGTPSFQELLNPHYEHHDPKKPLTIRYNAGPNHKSTPFVLDNSRNIYPQAEELLGLVEQNISFIPEEMYDQYKALMQNFIPLRDARIALIKSHMTDMSDEQARYTATFYTTRNTAVDFELLEQDRKDEYKKALAARKAVARKAERSKQATNANKAEDADAAANKDAEDAEDNGGRSQSGEGDKLGNLLEP